MYRVLIVLLLIITITSTSEKLLASRFQSKHIEVTKETIKYAEKNFRVKITKILNEISIKHGFNKIINNWIIVSPHTCYFAPIALFKGVERLNIQDLAKGKDIGLAIFSVPKGSEISSGIYTMYIYQSKGHWFIKLKNLKGITVIEKEAQVHLRSSKKLDKTLLYTGRLIGIFSENGKPMYGVKFGADLPVGSFYTVLRLKTGKPSLINNRYFREIIRTLKAFRSCIRSNLGLKKDVFIASRSDALIIASLDPSGKILSYLRLNKNLKGPFKIGLRKNSFTKKHISSINTRFQNLESYKFMNVGIIGGMIGNRINLGYVGYKTRSFGLSLSVSNF